MSNIVYGLIIQIIDIKLIYSIYTIQMNFYIEFRQQRKAQHWLFK
jgi:hypothetical protein